MIFGGGSAKTSSKPIEMQAAEFQALRNPFANILLAGLGGGSTGFLSTQFPEVPQPGMTGGEGAALSDIAGISTDPIRRALLSTTMAGGFLPGSGGSNPFLSAAITAAQDPTRIALEHALGRTIPGQFAAAGHTLGGRGSSAFELARSRGIEAGARELGNIASQMSFAGYEAERGRQTQAAQFSQSEIDQAIKNFQAQGLPRLLETSGLDKGIATGQQALTNWLQFMQTLGGVTQPAIGNVQTGQSTNFGKGLFGSLFPSGIYNPAAR